MKQPRPAPRGRSPRPGSRIPILLALLALGGFPSMGPLVAQQDVELLGLIYGTTPPAAYFDRLRVDPTAYQFSVEGPARLEAVQRASARDGRGIPLRSLLSTEAARSLGPRPDPVVGTFRFPLVLGLFSDSPATPPYDRSRVQQEFFDGPNTRGQTIPEFYAEMSRGQLNLVGVSSEWVRTSLTVSEVTLGSNGLSASRTGGVGSFIEAIVQALDASGMDWAPFDQTGDGYVDVLTVLHPTSGAECGGGGERIWSHRWRVSSVTSGRLPQGVRTATPGPGPGGFIHVNDYTIQPLLSCNGSAINEIGVFAHELGHGFGLPDLYGTGSSRYTGVGSWDLMAAGAWGCAGNTPFRPCPMGAWSRAMLGWVTVEPLARDLPLTELTLPPVQSSGRVLQLPSGNGSGDYLLLENRQRLGADVGIHEPGLLVWHIDPAAVSSFWPRNEVNANPNRMGVRLRTASGRRDMETTGGFGARGSRGDPHPGCIKDSAEAYLDPSVPCRTNPDFHAGTLSAAASFDGVPLGITLMGIEPLGSAPHDMRVRLSTQFQSLILRAVEDGIPTSTPPFRVDGAPLPAGSSSVRVSPFQTLTVEAPAGVPLSPGVRVGFEGWEDGAPRTRSIQVGLGDQTLTARYGGREVEVTWRTEVQGLPAGSPPNLVPGELVSIPARPDLWFPLGAPVTLEARPRPGFRFVAWLDPWAGASNPRVVTLTEPQSLGARFEVDFAFESPPPTLFAPAATELSLTFPVRNGNAPIRWEIAAGRLPEGLTLDGDRGVVQGASLEAGPFTLTLRARDALGLVTEIQVNLTLTVPDFTALELTRFWLLPGGIRPDELRWRFLDWNGNRNGFYDLGDLRAHLHRFGAPTPR